jgi:nitroreductase
MEALECLLSRRSIRKYSTDKIAKDIVSDLLKAGFAAPSAGNQQPWHFIVIEDRKVLNAIPEYHENAQMLKNAPLAIVICGDPRLEKYKGYWVQDCSAATQNILLAAHAKGLGAVWLGIYPRGNRVSKTKSLLELPDEILPLAIIALGYPAEIKEPSARWDDQKIHYNAW